MCEDAQKKKIFRKRVEPSADLLSAAKPLVTTISVEKHKIATCKRPFEVAQSSKNVLKKDVIILVRIVV